MPETRKRRRATEVFEAGRNPPRKRPKKSPSKASRTSLAELQQQLSQLAIDVQVEKVFEDDDIPEIDIYAEDVENLPPEVPDEALDEGVERPENELFEMPAVEQAEEQEYETKPYVTCRWRAFLGKEPLAHHQDFDDKAVLDHLYNSGLWRWADEVVMELAREDPPQRASIQSLSATVYTNRQPKETRLCKSLRRGDVPGFRRVLQQARQLKEQSMDVARIDFDLKLTPVSAEGSSQTSQSRNGGVLQNRPGFRLTATNQQLLDLPDMLAAEHVGNGKALEIHDRWRCQDSKCPNHAFCCWVSRTPGRPDRFEDHFPANSNIVAIWAREVTLGQSTVDEPSDNIRLSLANARTRAADEKAQRPSISVSN